jgi:hypothetical protein
MAPSPRYYVGVIRFASALILVLVLTACSSDQPAPTATPTILVHPTATTRPSPTPVSTPPATPVPTPRPGADTAPQGTQTGDPAIDSIIRALEGDDASSVAALVRLSTIPCTTEQGLGGPPKCEFAEGNPPDGTLVLALPILSCEPHWTFDPGETAKFIAAARLTLFAVAQIDQPAPLWQEPGYPAPQYVLFFEQTGNAANPTQRLSSNFFVQAGRIVVWDPGCVSPPEDRFEWIIDGSYHIILRGPAYQ